MRLFEIDSSILLKKYCKELKEKYDFDFEAFIKTNGLNKSVQLVENELNILKKDVNFNTKYCRDILILAALKNYGE